MRRIPLTVFLAALTALAAKPAAAIYMTAGELTQGCMAERPKDISNCLGYIAGVIDYHVMLQSLGTAPTIDFCLPDNVSIEDAAVVVMTYLRAAPHNSAFIAAPAIPMALNATFPCKE